MISWALTKIQHGFRVLTQFKWFVSFETAATGKKTSGGNKTTVTLIIVQFQYTCDLFKFRNRSNSTHEKMPLFAHQQTCSLLFELPKSVHDI